MYVVKIAEQIKALYLFGMGGVKILLVSAKSSLFVIKLGLIHLAKYQP